MSHPTPFMDRLTPKQWGGLVAALIIFFDQLTKLIMLHVVELPARFQIKVLPFFNFTYVENRGVSFGFLQADALWGRVLLIVFALGVTAFLIYLLLETTNLLLALAIGIIIGGAVGNAIDRTFYGYVVDFLDFSGLYFPWVFNIADSAISIGVVLLVYYEFFAKKTEPSADNGGQGTD